jgi:hypothetical protein
MYPLPQDVAPEPFRFFPVLIIPVLAIVAIVLVVFLLRHFRKKGD